MDAKTYVTGDSPGFASRKIPVSSILETERDKRCLTVERSNGYVIEGYWDGTIQRGGAIDLRLENATIIRLHDPTPCTFDVGENVTSDEPTVSTYEGGTVIGRIPTNVPREGCYALVVEWHKWGKTNPEKVRQTLYPPDYYTGGRYPLRKLES